MRKLLLVLLNVFQYRSRNRRPMLPATAASASSTSLVVAEPDVSALSALSSGLDTFPDSNVVTTTPRPSTPQIPTPIVHPPTLPTEALSASAPPLHGEAPTDHPFYQAPGHYDPNQLHSAIHFLGIHHDDPNHPTHPSANISVRVMLWLAMWWHGQCFLTLCEARCSMTHGYTRPSMILCSLLTSHCQLLSWAPRPALVLEEELALALPQLA